MFAEDAEFFGLQSSQGSASNPSSLSRPSIAKTTGDTAPFPGRDKIPINAQTKNSADRECVRNFHVVTAVSMRRRNLPSASASSQLWIYRR